MTKGTARKSGGRASRAKGDRLERLVVRLLQGEGVSGERVPLSGSAAKPSGRYSGDLTAPILGLDRVIECKARANGFREAYRWLAGADAVILKADRQPLLCIVPLRFALEVVKVAEESRALRHELEKLRRGRGDG